MINKEILEHPENDKVLGQMLAEEIEKARYNNSLAKVCNDLGIGVEV